LARESEKAEFARQRAERPHPEEAEREAHRVSLASWARHWTTVTMAESARRRDWNHALYLSAVWAKEPKEPRAHTFNRLCAVDQSEARAAVHAFLVTHAPELHLAAPPVVAGALDHLLVPVPDPEFCRWSELAWSLAAGVCGPPPIARAHASNGKSLVQSSGPGAASVTG
jgi:hypothetical protein